MLCEYCKNPLHEEATVCGHCGARLWEEEKALPALLTRTLLVLSLLGAPLAGLYFQSWLLGIGGFVVLFVGALLVTRAFPKNKRWAMPLRN